MRSILAFATASMIPGIALAHTSAVEHGHPHDGAHAYLGVEALALFAGAAVIAGVVVYAVRTLRGGRR